MKFGFNDISDNELISYFERVQSKLVIHYLDGTTKIIPYTDEYVKEITNLMMYQARLRDSKYPYSKIDDEINSSNEKLYVTLTYTVALFALHFEFDGNVKKALLALTGAAALLSFYRLRSCFKIDKIHDEILKYRIYLELCDSGNMDVLSTEYGIDINNIDSFRSSDIINVRKKINKRKIDN